MRAAAPALLAGLLAGACTELQPGNDFADSTLRPSIEAGARDAEPGPSPDIGPPDAVEEPDAFPPDAAESPDAIERPDLGPTDLGFDAGARDTGLPDARPRDATPRDALTLDARPRDALVFDAQPRDIGLPDTGRPDTGTSYCVTSAQCDRSEMCAGPPGCATPWTCIPAHACALNRVPYCNCHGVTVYGSSTCPPEPYISRGTCPTAVADAGVPDSGQGGVGAVCTLQLDCQPNLRCCYPCGLPGCQHRCTTPTDAGACPVVF